jgi:phosphotransferase system HPr (HPr) family protein
MREIQVTVKYRQGLHARPAVKFIKMATGIVSDITIIKNGDEYEAKGIVSLLSACITHGQTITIRVNGKDEDKAIAAIADFFEKS